LWGKIGVRFGTKFDGGSDTSARGTAPFSTISPPHLQDFLWDVDKDLF
jgi:hypothetical protein